MTITKNGLTGFQQKTVNVLSVSRYYRRNFNKSTLKQVHQFSLFFKMAFSLLLKSMRAPYFFAG